MKIGILTFHEGINHGGYFQAYGTFSFLKSRGYDVEIINYKNSQHFRNEYVTFLVTKDVVLLYKNIVKIFKFRKAHKKFKRTKFTTNCKKINTSVYDVIIVGSDIVWNYEWDFLGNDHIYFGECLESKKIISYAPSCGAVDLNNEVPKFVTQGLRKFKHISVRDENTFKMVKKAIDVQSKIVLDPTFIYDFSENVDISEECPFILIYAYTLKDDEIKSVIDYAKKHNLKLISIGYSNSWCDKNVIDIGPFEWLAYFKNATYILTSTFHGTIFSIKFEKKFAISNNDGIRTKIKTILKLIELDNRIIKDTNLHEIFDSNINYNAINKKLDVLIDDSRKYLINAIHD